MLWFLVLHISALLFWCASLLFLPSLIAGSVAPGRGHTSISTDGEDSAARFVYTRVASPAGVLAIIAGTLIFLPGYSVDVWLVIKLTLVVMLVVCHTLIGLMLMRAEEKKSVQPWCRILLVVMGVLMIAIVWLVLTKPSQEAFQWRL